MRREGGSSLPPVTATPGPCSPTGWRFRGPGPAGLRIATCTRGKAERKRIAGAIDPTGSRGAALSGLRRRSVRTAQTRDARCPRGLSLPRPFGERSARSCGTAPATALRAIIRLTRRTRHPPSSRPRPSTRRHAGGQEPPTRHRLSRGDTCTGRLDSRGSSPSLCARGCFGLRQRPQAPIPGSRFFSLASPPHPGRPPARPEAHRLRPRACRSA